MALEAQVRAVGQQVRDPRGSPHRRRPRLTSARQVGLRASAGFGPTRRLKAVLTVPSMVLSPRSWGPRLGAQLARNGAGGFTDKVAGLMALEINT
jgi:hypothetical protein